VIAYFRLFLLEMSTGRAAREARRDLVWPSLQFTVICTVEYCTDTGRTAIYKGKSKFSWNPLPLFTTR